MFFKNNSLTPLQLKPMRQVLNPIFIHFSGAESGISGISNSKVMLGLLLSIVIWNNFIVLILIGLVNTLLNKVLPSNSFQVFIFFLEGGVFFGAGDLSGPSVIEGKRGKREQIYFDCFFGLPTPKICALYSFLYSVGWSLILI